MKLVTRYLLRQYLGPLFTCLIAFNGLFILFDLFGRLSRFIDADLSFLTVLRYYGGVVSMYSHWFIPASCMLATLYTMWKLSHHSEITAMRASGISFHLLTLPFFGVALGMALLSFANAEYIAPNASAWSENLKDSGFALNADRLRKNHIYYNATARRKWIFGEVDASSEKGFSHLALTNDLPVSANNFIVQIKEEDENGTVIGGLRAKGADWRNGCWYFSSPEFVEYQNGEERKRDPLKFRRVPDLIDRHDLTETPRDMMIAQRDWNFMSSSDRHRLLEDNPGADSEKWFDYWYGLAAPWTCIVITLFAIPAGITTGRQSVFKGVALVLATFFGFYAVTLSLEYIGQHGYMNPFLSAWLPNAVFLVVGAAMYRKLT